MLKQVVGSPRQASLSRPHLPVGLVTFLPPVSLFLLFSIL